MNKFNRLKKMLAVFPVIFMIVSCVATPIKTQYESLETKPVCCKELSELNYKSLDPETKNKTELNETSQVFQFGNQKSYVAGFALPEHKDNYFVARSYFNGTFIGQFLDPIFIALDENHKPLLAFSLKMEFLPGNLFNKDEIDGHMAGAFDLPEDAKYLVVFTLKSTDNAGTADIPASSSAYMIGNTVQFAPVAAQSIPLERSPSGKIAIQVKPKKKTDG